MEGNYILQLKAAQQLYQLTIEKPIIVQGTQGSKHTFALDHETGQPYITEENASSEDELDLLKSKKQFEGMKLLRGLWKEKVKVENGEVTIESSGTFFPVAAPEGKGTLWASAGHCTLPEPKQWRFRSIYGTDGLSQRAEALGMTRRECVNLDWLKDGIDDSQLFEYSPSSGSCIINNETSPFSLPDFGFIQTDAAYEVQHLFIPSARTLEKEETICVLGFAHPTDKRSPIWAQYALRTEADYGKLVNSGQSPPPDDWVLDPEVARQRLVDLEVDGVVHPQRLAACPGRVCGVTERIIEHSCSTFPGISGGPGVDMKFPWQFSFVHVQSDHDVGRNNHGYSVHHPLFVKAYMREVLPSLLSTPNISLERMECLLGYLECHKECLHKESPITLDDVRKRCEDLKKRTTPTTVVL